MTDKLWCLRTHKHVALVPDAVVERVKESNGMISPSMLPTGPSIKTVILAALINLVVTSVIVFFIWNYAIVGAVAFAKTISIFQAVGLTAFLNLFIARK